jgi:hypothetical protein
MADLMKPSIKEKSLAPALPVSRDPRTPISQRLEAGF